MTYQVVKRYGHEEGWSCTFRQWRATHSHCRFIHGYPLAFEFTFECSTLNDKNWCMDFGGLKPLKNWLQSMFDHKMLVAEDDPQLEFFRAIAGSRGDDPIADVVIVKDVGCEKFAELAYMEADCVLLFLREKPRVTLKSVRVSEHGGNSAIYSPREEEGAET